MYSEDIFLSQLSDVDDVADEHMSVPVHASTSVPKAHRSTSPTESSQSRNDGSPGSQGSVASASSAGFHVLSTSRAQGNVTAVKRKTGNGAEKSLGSEVPKAKRSTNFTSSNQTITPHLMKSSQDISPMVRKGPSSMSPNDSTSSTQPRAIHSTDQPTLMEPLWVVCTANPQFRGSFLPQKYLSDSGHGKPKSHIRCIKVLTIAGLDELITPSEFIRRCGVSEELDWLKVIKSVTGKSLQSVLEQLDLSCHKASQKAAVSERNTTVAPGGRPISLPNFSSTLQESGVSHGKKAGTSHMQSPTHAISGSSGSTPQGTLPNNHGSAVPLAGKTKPNVLASSKRGSQSSGSSTDDEGACTTGRSNVTVSSGSQPQDLSSERDQIIDKSPSRGQDTATSAAHTPANNSAIDTRVSSSPVLGLPTGDMLNASLQSVLGNFSIAVNSLNPTSTHLQAFHDGVDNAVTQFTNSIEEKVECARKALASVFQREQEKLRKRELELEQKEKELAEKEEKIQTQVVKIKQCQRNIMDMVENL